MPTVTFQKSGQTVELAQNSSLLDLEDTSQTELDFGCRSAACGTCTIDVVSGMHNLCSKSDEEEELLNDLDINGTNRRLACQCQLFGDITISPVE